MVEIMSFGNIISTISSVSIISLIPIMGVILLYFHEVGLVKEKFKIPSATSNSKWFPDNLLQDNIFIPEINFDKQFGEGNVENLKKLAGELILESIKKKLFSRFNLIGLMVFLTIFILVPLMILGKIIEDDLNHRSENVRDQMKSIGSGINNKIEKIGNQVHEVVKKDSKIFFEKQIKNNFSPQNQFSKKFNEPYENFLNAVESEGGIFIKGRHPISQYRSILDSIIINNRLSTDAIQLKKLILDTEKKYKGTALVYSEGDGKVSLNEKFYSALKVGISPDPMAIKTLEGVASSLIKIVNENQKFSNDPWLYFKNNIPTFSISLNLASNSEIVAIKNDIDRIIGLFSKNNRIGSETLSSHSNLTANLIEIFKIPFFYLLFLLAIIAFFNLFLIFKYNSIFFRNKSLELLSLGYAIRFATGAMDIESRNEIVKEIVKKIITTYIIDPNSGLQKEVIETPILNLIKNEKT